MPLPTVEEIGRDFQVNEKGEIIRRYFATGAATEPAAGAQVYAHLEATIGTPPNIGSTVVKHIRGTEKTVNGYRVQVTWGTFQKKPPPAKGESSFHFEIATAPVRVVVPIGDQEVFGRPGAPTIQPRLIGDQGNGDAPAGVEVFEPTHSESETHYLDWQTAFSSNYKNQVKKLVGRTNSALWKGHQPGEVLLVSVSGSRRGVDDAEVSFRWQVRENQTNLTVAGITGINKQGFQYLWPRHRLEPSGDGKALTAEITHVVVATVFRSGSMSLLNIGT